MKCNECQDEVSKEREEFGCTICYSCASKKKPIKGIMLYDNLTAVGIQIVPAERFDKVKHLLHSNTESVPVIES